MTPSRVYSNNTRKIGFPFLAAVTLVLLDFQWEVVYPPAIPYRYGALCPLAVEPLMFFYKSYKAQANNTKKMLNFENKTIQRDGYQPYTHSCSELKNLLKPTNPEPA